MADSFTMISGGEKMLVRLAIDIGLALLSFSRCAQKPELVCLDEVFDPLDAYHTASVFRLINKLKEKFSRVLVISHKADINTIIKNQILIEKDTGILGTSKVKKIT
jgi:DNA repair exonuclease SbcCD ATPase subunit